MHSINSANIAPNSKGNAGNQADLERQGKEVCSDLSELVGRQGVVAAVVNVLDITNILNLVVTYDLEMNEKVVVHTI